MKTLVFTAKKLLDVLSELERIEDGEMFRRYVFKIIHSEVMKASYLNVRHLETDTYDGNNILVSDLVLAGQQSQDQMLIFCCGLDDSGEVAHRLMREIQATRITLEALQQQKHELSYWRASDYRQRYELHKQEKSLLQKTYLFVDIGNLFLFMFKQRSLGTIVDFKRELMRYSRHRVKGPVVKPLSVWSLTSSLRK